MNTTQVGTSAPRHYARARARVRAAVTDSMLYGASLLAVLMVLELTHLPNAVAMPLFWGWVAAALAYEPALVSWRGATLGHMLNNLRVLDAASGAPPSLVRSVGRTWLKMLFGLVSFAWMSLTRRHQALHDVVTRTLVEVADLSRAQPGDYLLERAPDTLVVPVPAWRRLLAIATGLALTSGVYMLVLGLVLSPACLAGRCNAADRLWTQLMGSAWVGTQAACVVLGWRGRLPAARS